MQGMQENYRQITKSYDSFLLANLPASSREMGEEYLNRFPSKVLEMCSSARALNSSGQSAYSEVARSFKVSRQVERAGLSYQQATFVVNALDYAQHRMCPDVW